MSVSIGPWSVTRGPILPHRRQSKTSQKVDKAEDGSVGVSDAHYDDDILYVLIRADITTISDIYHWIKNGVRYSARAFQYTDENGVELTVRYWKNTVQYRIIGGDLAEMELPLRKEIAT